VRARASASETSNDIAARRERIDALLGRLGYCARARVNEFLKAHVVSIAGARALDGKTKALARDVAVDGEELDHANGILLVMHKPRGVVCSHDANEGATVYEALPERWRKRSPGVETVGRLDKDTTGLLLFTDDGALNHALTSPKKDIGKWYRVRTSETIPTACVEVFASGTLTLSGETKACKPARCEIIAPNEARIELSEGKYHQVKRMFAVFKCTVVELHRESFGALSIDGLKPGEYKTLPLDFNFGER